jgi:dethiobiotin synthetase
MNISSRPDTRTSPATLFFSGSDTSVGKSYTAALAARQFHKLGKRVGVYKPVASGCRVVDNKLESEDAKQLWVAAGKPLTLKEVAPQCFGAPLAPNRAASAEGKMVDKVQLVEGAHAWFDHCDLLVIEGAGGLLSPLADGWLNIHLVRALCPLRLILVVADRLGAVHQSLATINAALQFGVRPDGVILSETHPETAIPYHASEIARYTDVPILAQIAFNTQQSLTDCLIPLIDH